MPTVAINAQLLSGVAGYRQAGIHTYIHRVLSNLPQDEWLRYRTFTQRGAETLLPTHLNASAGRLPTERPIVRIGWEQAAWPLLARQNGADLLHSMAFVTPVASRLPKIVTVYDLSPIHYPDRLPRFKRWYLQTQTRRSVRAAARVVAISHDGKRDLHETFGVPLDKISVVTPGVNELFRPISKLEVEAFRQKEGLTRPFVLHVGTLQPRKNITTLIDAFARLKDDSFDLVLVGGKGWLFNEIFAKVDALGIRNRVHFTGFVPSEALPYFYNAASLFVMPSVYEGFGIPVADAMACGTPVVVANASSLPEVAGEAGLLFEPSDSSALAECMSSVLYNPAQAAIMRGAGLTQSEKFSWIQAGREMADIYRQTAQET